MTDAHSAAGFAQGGGHGSWWRGGCPLRRAVSAPNHWQLRTLSWLLKPTTMF